MNEAKFTTKLKKWIRYRFQGTAAIEVKYTEGKSIPFSAVQEHQHDALFRVKHGRIAYKIPDDSRGRKPFDMLVYDRAPAYVCLYFYSRGEKEFYMIDIDVWDELERELDRKSITKELAKKHAEIIGELGS